jgi:CBS domain-containing protein
LLKFFIDPYPKILVKLHMEQTVVELIKLNEKVDAIIDIMEKPESKFLKLMEVVGNAVGIIGILAIVDIIRNWVLGG